MFDPYRGQRDDSAKWLPEGPDERLSDYVLNDEPWENLGLNFDPIGRVGDSSEEMLPEGDGSI